jgi:hypothetical protein
LVLGEGADNFTGGVTAREYRQLTACQFRGTFPFLYFGDVSPFFGLRMQLRSMLTEKFLYKFINLLRTDNPDRQQKNVLLLIQFTDDNCRQIYIGGFLDFFFNYSTLLHLAPLRFHCGGGCWDRTQDSSDFGIGCQTL